MKMRSLGEAAMVEDLGPIIKSIEFAAITEANN
jgi:hypothetical protein